MSNGNGNSGNPAVAPTIASASATHPVRPRQKLSRAEEHELADGCELDNPIRRLNVRFDLPTRLGIRFIGRTEPETKDLVDEFVGFLERYAARKTSEAEDETKQKVYECAVLAALWFIRGLAKRTDSPQGSIAAMMIEYTNAFNQALESRGINSDICGGSGLDINHVFHMEKECESGVRGVRYRRGDVPRGGIVPYGWQKDDRGALIENDHEQQVIGMIYRMYSDGYSVASIARHLDHDGILSRSGKNWSRRTVRDILNRGHIDG